MGVDVKLLRNAVVAIVAAFVLCGGRLESAAARRPVNAGDTIRLENARLRIGFIAADGRLVELIDRATGQPFIIGGPADPWVLNQPLSPQSPRVAPAVSMSIA